MQQPQPSGMAFSKLSTNAACQCPPTNSSQDTANEYLHIVSRKRPKEADFKSRWEQGKTSYATCEKECHAKGVSFYQSPAGDGIIQTWKTSQKFKPWLTKSRKYLCWAKFTYNAGLLLHTPNDSSAHHYTFFKCDAFTVKSLVITKVEEFKV